MKTKHKIQGIYVMLLVFSMALIGNQSAKGQCVADFTHNTMCNNIAFFFDLSTAGSGQITSWWWNFGDGYASNLRDPVHQYTAPGTYNVVLIIEADIGCVDTVSNEILIHEIPQADFTFDTVCCGTPTHFTDLSIPGEGNTIVSWYWHFGDGYTSTSQNPNHTYSDPGIYTAELIISADCGCIDTVSKEVVAEDHAKVKSRTTADPNLIIYPNPLQDEAEISFQLTHPARVIIEVISTSGKVVAGIRDEQYLAGEHQLRWNSINLMAGLYLLRITFNGTEAYTVKVIKGY